MTAQRGRLPLDGRNIRYSRYKREVVFTCIQNFDPSMIKMYNL